jgi:hypothetical protein
VTAPESLTAAAEEFVADVRDGVWDAFRRRGISDGSPVETHVSWRCPTVESAEALETALWAAGMPAGAAPPHAEARGAGYGVAAVVPFLAGRENFDVALDRAIRLGVAHGAELCAVGTMFDD